jgi:hypothetical protein
MDHEETVSPVAFWVVSATMAAAKTTSVKVKEKA